MLTTKEVAGVKVVRPNKPGREYTKDGLPRHRRKIGKIYKTVFAPDGMRVVGFIVRRPDLLWMFKRPERFLALDAFDIQDGLVVPSRGMASWDDKAIERMGVDYDTCIIWEGIQVKTRSGAELGHVGDISFDEKTGELNSLFLDDGGVARSLIGAVEIPAELMATRRASSSSRTRPPSCYPRVAWLPRQARLRPERRPRAKKASRRPVRPQGRPWTPAPWAWASSSAVPSAR